MYQFFTAKIGKRVEIKNGTTNAAFVQLDIVGEQDVEVLSALAQALPTQGKSEGVLLPYEGGVAAHLVLDLAFVRRLEPGTLLRFEWETHSGGIMSGLSALARRG